LHYILKIHIYINEFQHLRLLEYFDELELVSDQDVLTQEEANRILSEDTIYPSFTQEAADRLLDEGETEVVEVSTMKSNNTTGTSQAESQQIPVPIATKELTAAKKVNVKSRKRALDESKTIDDPVASQICKQEIPEGIETCMRGNSGPADTSSSSSNTGHITTHSQELKMPVANTKKTKLQKGPKKSLKSDSTGSVNVSEEGLHQLVSSYAPAPLVKTSDMMPNLSPLSSDGYDDGWVMKNCKVAPKDVDFTKSISSGTSTKQSTGTGTGYAPDLASASLIKHNAIVIPDINPSQSNSANATRNAPSNRKSSNSDLKTPSEIGQVCSSKVTYQKPHNPNNEPNHSRLKAVVSAPIETCPRLTTNAMDFEDDGDNYAIVLPLSTRNRNSDSGASSSIKALTTPYSNTNHTNKPSVSRKDKIKKVSQVSLTISDTSDSEQGHGRQMVAVEASNSAAIVTTSSTSDLKCEQQSSRNNDINSGNSSSMATILFSGDREAVRVNDTAKLVSSESTLYTESTVSQHDSSTLQDTDKQQNSEENPFILTRRKKQSVTKVLPANCQVVGDELGDKGQLGKDESAAGDAGGINSRVIPTKVSERGKRKVEINSSVSSQAPNPPSVTMPKPPHLTNLRKTNYVGVYQNTRNKYFVAIIEELVNYQTIVAYY
jgi:hypothetical protein